MDGQGLFDAITDSAILLDKAGRVVHWNLGASTLFGYTRKEMLGKSINHIYPHQYPFPKLIQEIIVKQKKWQADTDFVCKDGSRGVCKSNLVPLLQFEQYKSMALLIHHDLSTYKNILLDQPQLETLLSSFLSANNLLIDMITIQEKLERKLQESDLRFRLLAENAMDIISRHAPDGTYLYVSPACLSSLGYRSEELIGKSIYKLIHHDDYAKIKKIFNRRKEMTNHKPIAYRIKRKEGEIRWLESNIRLIIDNQTNIINEIQLASRDITDRILDKKARLRGQQLAHVFRLSSMEEMASGMAHEISQPLAAIVNYTRGCVRHLENSEHDRTQLLSIMEKAVIQAERAGEIVQRLKNFFCKGQLIKTACKINNVIRETVSLFKNELTLSNTKIDFELDKNIPIIFIDKIQVQQVLLNLMQNAIEAMQEHHIKKKRIHIRTKINHHDMIEISLTDTGIGFSKEIINKVFMPFFTTKAHGRGMGLAICRSIIEAHGGQFTINPNTNDVSWIRFSLPTVT